MVELALLLPVLMAILLGIIEVSLILNDHSLLRHAALEGARAAALEGRTVAEIREVTLRAAQLPPADPSRIDVDFCADASGVAWTPAMDKPDRSGNDIPKSAMVRVRIRGFRHRLVTGSFFAFLPGCSGGSFEMSAFAVRGRE